MKRDKPVMVWLSQEERAYLEEKARNTNQSLGGYFRVLFFRERNFWEGHHLAVSPEGDFFRVTISQQIPHGWTRVYPGTLEGMACFEMDGTLKPHLAVLPIHGN